MNEEDLVVKLKDLYESKGIFDPAFLTDYCLPFLTHLTNCSHFHSSSVIGL